MKSQKPDLLFTTSFGKLAVAACAAAVSATVLAQDDAGAISELTVVDVEQTGNPPAGPYDVVVEHDPGLATHTIYRPAELSMREHPVLVWGEGGCANNGLMFPEYLSEIASHGFVVVADGPPAARGPAPADRMARRLAAMRRPAPVPVLRVVRPRAARRDRAPVPVMAWSTARIWWRRSTGSSNRIGTEAVASSARSIPTTWPRWACRAAD